MEKFNYVCYGYDTVTKQNGEIPINAGSVYEAKKKIMKSFPNFHFTSVISANFLN